ncbi:MAG: DUF4340 domain-containing protein [Candidatus Methylomirabilis sp.]|nr:DUF4340 domain-containing protein [Candidatus Methylomirabilis sp.]
MRWRSLGVLALLLVLVGVVYYALEGKGTQSGSDGSRLFQADEKEIETISIRKGDALIVLTREGEGWRLTEPVRATADSTEVGSLLHVLLDAQKERQIEETPQDLADYGLDHPSLHLSLTLKGGHMLPTLLLGDLNPNGRSVYAKRPDQPAVFLVTVMVRLRTDKKPDDFRDKTLLVLEPNQVTRIELIGTGQPISLSRTHGKGWEMARPITGRADAAVIGQMLWKIKDARVEAFADSAGPGRQAPVWPGAPGPDRGA